MKTLYTAHADAVSGRNGHAKTNDRALDLDIVPPDSGKEGTNPEQLFACAFAACFGGAIKAAAKKMDVEAGNVEVTADVSLNEDNGRFSLGAALDATLETDDDTAAKLVALAHEICPYSSATRGNINVSLSANGHKVSA